MQKIKLRYYQEEVQQALLKALLIDNINPLVESATGTGKSLMIANLIKYFCEKYKGFRVLATAPKQELILQNANTLASLTNIDIGICCSGLNEWSPNKTIVFAMPNSIHRRLNELGVFNMLVMDEPHTTPIKEQSMQRKVMQYVEESRPTARLVGFDATPYKMKGGRLDDGNSAIFDKTVYSYTIAQGIKDGYLSSLISRSSLHTADLTKAKTAGEDFILSTVQEPVKHVISSACNEFIELGKDRKSWLIFCSSLDHCNLVLNHLTQRKISCAIVSSETDKASRESYLNQFKAGKIRALINVDVLTTGFDAPSVDLIVLLRPTKSLRLYVQMLGRGTRLAEGKTNCLVLDYVDNLVRFGAVDLITPELAKKIMSGKRKAVFGKKCPECYTVSAPSIAFCPKCNFKFIFKQKIQKNADSKSKVITFEHGDVDFIEVFKPSKQKKTITCSVVDYQFSTCKTYSGLETLKITFNVTGSRVALIEDFLPFNNPKARFIAKKKWKALGGLDPAPATVKEANERAKELRTIIGLAYERDKNYIKILKYIVKKD